MAWVIAHPDIRLRTPAQRCPLEFQQLFRLKYTKEHGAGLIVQPNKTMLRFEYTPASASFGGAVQLESSLRIPDITILIQPNRQLQALVDFCENQLEPYSRWLGKNSGARGATEGAALLPGICRRRSQY